jgi:flagellar motor switch protein FliN/FliY
MPQYPQAPGYGPQTASPQMPGYQQPPAVNPQTGYGQDAAGYMQLPGMNPMAAGYNPQTGAYGAQPPVYNSQMPGMIPQTAGMNPQTAGIPGMQGTPYPPAVNPYMQPGQYQPQYPGYPPQMPQQYSPYPNTAPPVQGAQKEPSAPAENQILKQAVNVQNVQFPVFSGQQSVFSAPLSNGNIDMLMNVPLNVSIEIGRTKKKIRDIMDFNQGSIIELEKQAGAPVDIIVNGQLMARGDVVVIDDNFAVRITEIIGTKELISSVEGTAK